MKKFAVRSDMEGLFGVVNWDEVIPGRSLYPNALERLHRELGALSTGLLEAGADSVEIYDEHYFGLNVDVAWMAGGVSVIRGKPPYRTDWPGGLDASFSGLILQGYHAMAGVADAILPHTYEPEIQAIWINGKLVGEIGVETAVAGEAGVPLLLFVGDAHGAHEAQELVPGVACVVVKEGRGAQCGHCRSWLDVAADLAAATRKIVQDPPSIRPLVFEPPIQLRVQLAESEFRRQFFADHPQLAVGEDVVGIEGRTVTQVWARYWAIKDQILAQTAPAS